MASTSSIEIFEHTLLKLLIRRGTNAERLNVILNEGELGFTTDSMKLYVGDGATFGGVQVTGSKFLGAAGDITTLSPADINDLAFSTSFNGLYYLATGDGATLSDWVEISKLYTTSDGTISIDGSNNISLGDVAGAGLEKDINNRLEIASEIAVDVINKKTDPNTTYLEIPSKIAVGVQSYTLPEIGIINGYAKLNPNGIITWDDFEGTNNAFVNTEVLPVGTIVAYTNSVLPSSNKFLFCNGAYIKCNTYPALSSIVNTNFGALSTNGSDTYFKLPLLSAIQSNVNYIIKSRSDDVANCLISLFDTISASIGGTPVGAINPLSGQYTIGLKTVGAPIDMGFISINNKGQIDNYDNSTPGVNGVAAPNATPIVHTQSFINFLRTPVEIVSDTIWGTVLSNWSKTFKVFPAITNVLGLSAIPTANIPVAAKNIILDVQGKSTNIDNCLLAGAPNVDSLSVAATSVLGSNEYLMYTSTSTNSRTGGQIIIPLSGTDSNPLSGTPNTRTFAMRGFNTSNAQLSVRVIGWTL